MKTAAPVRLHRPFAGPRVSSLLLGALLVAVGHASERKPQPDEAMRGSHAAALAAARAGSPSAADAALAPAIRAQPGSAEWHLAMAQRLLHLAVDLSASSGGANVRSTVDRALRHLDSAEARAQKPRAIAAAQSMRGFLYDRFLGDKEAALAAYRAAAARTPGQPAVEGRVSQLEAAVSARRKVSAEGGAR